MFKSRLYKLSDACSVGCVNKNFYHSISIQFSQLKSEKLRRSILVVVIFNRSTVVLESITNLNFQLLSANRINNQCLMSSKFQKLAPDITYNEI